MSIFTDIMRLFWPSSGYQIADRVQLQDPNLQRAPLPAATGKQYTEEIRKNSQSQCRWYYKNDPIVARTVDTMAREASGLILQAQSNSAAFNERAERLWRKWWNGRPEITGRHSGRHIERMISVALDVDGELFLVKTRDAYGRPALQILESWQLDYTEANGMPLTIDRAGRVTAYTFQGYSGGSVKVKAGHVIASQHLPTASALRGEPTLLPSVSSHADRSHLQDTVMTKAEHEARVVNVLSQADRVENNNLPVFDEYEGSTEEENAVQSVCNNESDLYRASSRISAHIGGSTVALPAGFKLDSKANNTPGATYAPYLDSLLACNAGLNLPFAFLNPSGTGTANRLLLKLSANHISERSLDIAETLSSVFRWFISCQIAAGKFSDILLPDNYMQHEFQLPKSISIDIRQDKVEAELVGMGMLPLADYYEQRGMNWRTEVDMRIQAYRETAERCLAAGLDPATVFPAIFKPKTTQTL